MRRNTWASHSHYRWDRRLELARLKRFIKENTLAVDGGCHEWTGNVSPAGYGRLRVDGVLVFVHRLVFALARLEVPGADDVHHRCENKRCVNPKHLERLTSAEHTRRHATKEVCPRGHSMADAYSRPDGRGRQCRPCIRLRYRPYEPKPKPQPRNCNVCGREFTPKRNEARRCGQRCRMEAFKSRRAARLGLAGLP